jgi:hypothetical protein
MSTPKQRVPCQFCQKDYSKQQDQLLHTTKVHHDEALTAGWVECSYETCASVFPTKPSMDKHFKRMHESTQIVQGDMPVPGKKQVPNSKSQSPHSKRIQLISSDKKVVENGNVECQKQNLKKDEKITENERERVTGHSYTEVTAQNVKIDDSSSAGDKVDYVDYKGSVDDENGDCSENGVDDDNYDTEIEANLKILTEEISQVRKRIYLQTVLKSRIVNQQIVPHQYILELKTIQHNIEQQQQLLLLLNQQWDVLQTQMKQHERDKNQLKEQDQKRQNGQQLVQDDPPQRSSESEHAGVMPAETSFKQDAATAQPGEVKNGSRSDPRPKQIMLQVCFKNKTSLKRKRIVLEPAVKSIKKLRDDDGRLNSNCNGQKSSIAAEKKIVLQPSIKMANSAPLNKLVPKVGQHKSYNARTQTSQNLSKFDDFTAMLTKVNDSNVVGKSKTVVQLMIDGKPRVGYLMKRASGGNLVSYYEPMELTHRPDFFPEVGPYRCELCDTFAVTNVDFVKHVKSQHRDDVDEQVLAIMESHLQMKPNDRLRLGACY